MLHKNKLGCKDLLSCFLKGSLVLTLVTLLSGIALSSVSVSADGDASTVDNINITIPVACTITPTIDSAHTTTINPNTYEDDIGLTTIKTVCNDSNGYSIYAVGYTNEEFGNTNLIGQNTNQTIVTGTATGANSSDPSNWAMKINAVTGTYAPTIENGFSSYRTVPSTWTKVATFASSTDATIGSSIQSTYAAYIAGTQATDTYTGKVKYTLVHPSTDIPPSPQTSQANRICYYANASDAVGTMGCQTIPSSGGSATTVTPTSAVLLASNFSRAGYGFAGWSDSYDYATNPNAKFYGPQEYIEFTEGEYSGTNEGLSLYAVWVKSEGSLQDSSKVSSVCNRLTQAGPSVTPTLNSVSALTDQRDNETYAIAKLADGNCWMIENLRLESTNSDNSAGALAQGYGTSAAYGNFSGLANAESANFTSTNGATDTTEPNSLYYAGIQSGTASIDISQTNYAGYRMPRYNNYNHQTTSANRPQNPTANTSTNSTTSAGMYSYGNYYTWAAAMANTGYYNTTTIDENGYTPSEAANTSLCPKGWKLPYGRDTDKGATSGGFSNLDIALGGTGAASSSSTTPTGDDMSKSWRSYPNNFLYSGAFYGSSASNRGFDGLYWSSTAYHYYGSYYLYLSSSSIDPGASNYRKYSGNSIRCVAGS